jgi:hypothetical protein
LRLLIRPQGVARLSPAHKRVVPKLPHTISCISFQGAIQYAGMSQSVIPSKWKFIVEFEDEETQEISGTIGQASSREECEELIEYDMQHHIVRGRIIVNAEAAEICARCAGEGKLAAGNGGFVICDACGGHIGAISKLRAAQLQCTCPI